MEAELILAGRLGEALDRLEHAQRPELGVIGDLTGLPAPPLEAESIAEALVLRAYAVAGNADAAEALGRAAKALAMPGLLLNL